MTKINNKIKPETSSRWKLPEDLIDLNITQSSSFSSFEKYYLPETDCNWQIVDSKTRVALNALESRDSLHNTTRFSNWEWPEEEFHFISDIHADAEALVSSLILSGTIKTAGANTTGFDLTLKGKHNRIIIGGDCLDKGPSNLGLLRTLHVLIQHKKNTILLAGNHDLRLYMGLKSMSQKNNSAAEHFFVRMGKKVIPLLKEVYNEYLKDSDKKLNLPSIEKCRKLLFPSKQWQKAFQKNTLKLLTDKTIQIELQKINKKWSHFESNCEEYGLTLPMAYLAAKKCHSLFMEPEGEFYWFFNSMQLIHKEKSFLFTHAGVDNDSAEMVEKLGYKGVNTLYRNLLEKDLCYFYYGNVANMLRTKYRNKDKILTKKGVKCLHRLGIHAVVHGHVSQLRGQQLSVRKGLLHFECDITLDINSRIKAGLPGYGAGVTIISPSGNVKGISSDVTYIKSFKPEMYLTSCSE
jgi:Calcineurin-like phosphoesterase